MSRPDPESLRRVSSDNDDRSSVLLAKLNFFIISLTKSLEQTGTADIKKEGERYNKIRDEILILPNSEIKDILNKKLVEYYLLIKNTEVALNYNKKIKELLLRAEFLGKYLSSYEKMTPNNKADFVNDCQKHLAEVSEIQKNILENTNPAVRELIKKNYQNLNIATSKIKSFLATLK